MRGSCLQGFAVLHHGFNAIGVDSTRKFFVLGFASADDRHGQRVFAEFTVSFQHAGCFFLCFFGGCMGGMAFLP